MSEMIENVNTEVEEKEYIYNDYTGYKNETQAKNAARADAMNMLKDFLIEKFGPEAVGMIDKNTIGVIIGTVNDKDGCPCDMIVALKPTIKNYQDHSGEKAFIKAFDFVQAQKEFKSGLPSEE